MTLFLASGPSLGWSSRCEHPYACRTALPNTPSLAPRCFFGIIALGERGGHFVVEYADIVSGVIHDRAERLRAARRREVVNNSAADESARGPRRASARSRSRIRDPKRVNGRVPGEPKASASTFHRTAGPPWPCPRGSPFASSTRAMVLYGLRIKEIVYPAWV